MSQVVPQSHAAPQSHAQQSAGIGLPMDTSDVLGLPPSIVIYGAPGLGKTTAAALTFPGVLYVQSSPSILHAYAHMVSMSPGLPPVPERVTIDERTVAQHFNGSYVTAISTIVERYVAACDANRCPYSGIVFDEWNVICERMFAELKSDPWGKFKGRSGSVNIFAVFDAFKMLHRNVLSLARRTRRMVGFIAHYQGPKLDEDENSPTKGAIKWPGGPKMPMGLSDQVVELCADADVVLQLTMKEPTVGLQLMMMPVAGGSGDAANSSGAGGGANSSGAQAQAPSPHAQRVFLTQPDNKWFRKVRGFGVEREEVLDLSQGKGLRELLLRAGFRM